MRLFNWFVFLEIILVKLGLPEENFRALMELLLQAESTTYRPTNNVKVLKGIV